MENGHCDAVKDAMLKSDFADFMNLVENPKRKYVDDENGTSRRKKRKPTTRKVSREIQH